jgi:iron complex transport system substrate-binding protein
VKTVSLLPSTTEVLFAIGAGDDVVGVTFECDFPAEARTRRIVSNTTLPHGLTPAEIDAVVKQRLSAGEDLYSLDEGALRDLDADLVVTQDLCAVCAVAVANVDEALAHLGCRAEVLTVDPMTLDEVIASITTLGDATGHAAEAGTLVRSLRARLDAVRAAVARRPPRRVAVLEWTDPLFCAGHWVPDLVTAAGGTVALGTRSAWPTCTKPGPTSLSYRLAGTASTARRRWPKSCSRPANSPPPRCGPWTPTPCSCVPARASSTESQLSRRSCTPAW